MKNNIANLTDASEQLEKQYTEVSSQIQNRLRMIMEMRIAFNNLEYELKSAISKCDEQIKIIQDNYK